MRPIIGVVPLWDDEKESIWMIPGYLNAIRESGGVPIILPLIATSEDITQLCSLCSGFLFTGGQDVDPKLYNQDPDPKCGQPNIERDTLERIIFDYATAVDKPILGICRGIQLINVLCGGTLYQDLPSQWGSGVNHQMTPPYDRVQHHITILENTPLSEILDERTLGVNSYHHQSICDLAPSLLPMAISEDGIIEAIYMPDRSFIIALQWHPELNYHCDSSSRKIVERFIEVARV